jgi:hypothetical protein
MKEVVNVRKQENDKGMIEVALHVLGKTENSHRDFSFTKYSIQSKQERWTKTLHCVWLEYS